MEHSRTFVTLAPALTDAVRHDALCDLVGKRVCIHSGGLSVAGRLFRSTGDIFKVSIDTSDSFADAPVHPASVKNISYSHDTATPDGLVAFIYLK